MTSFLQVVELLLTDDTAKAAYAENPNGFMAEHGLESLDSADVADAMQYAGDALPLPVAARLDPEAGLDSAAALNLADEGLTLEREPMSDDVPAELGEDVDFDTDDAAAAVDALDAQTEGRSIADEAETSIDEAELPQTDADAGESDTTDALDELTAEDAGVDLTEFVPTEDAVVETEDESLVDDIDELEAIEFTNTDPEDLDFLD